MNEHQAVVDYLVAKGENSWRVGIQATEALRQIATINSKSPKYSIELIWSNGRLSPKIVTPEPWRYLDGALADFGDRIAGYIVRTILPQSI